MYFITFIWLENCFVGDKDRKKILNNQIKCKKKALPALFGEGRTLFFLLFAEFGIDFEEGRDDIGHNAGYDDYEEEGGIAHTLL